MSTTAARWYLDRDGVQWGPVDWDRVQSMARVGHLRPTDLVRRDGTPFWQPACDARTETDGAAPGPTATGYRDGPERIPPAPVAAEVEPAGVGLNNVRPAVTPSATAPGARPAAGRHRAGTAVLALVLAAGGLFWFGLLFGGLGVVLGHRALTTARRPADVAGRRVALLAILLGAGDVLVVTTALAARLAAGRATLAGP